MRAGDRAWTVMAVGIAAYEWWADDDELLSAAADRWMVRHPWAVRLGVLIVASHVANIAPKPIDPIHWLVALKHA